MPKLKTFTNERNLPSPFQPVKRIDICDYIDPESLRLKDEFRTVIQQQCVDIGKPLVIANINKLQAWDNNVFELENLKSVQGDHVIKLLNVKTSAITEERMADYIDKLREQPVLSKKRVYDDHLPHSLLQDISKNEVDVSGLDSAPADIYPAQNEPDSREKNLDGLQLSITEKGEVSSRIAKSATSFKDTVDTGKSTSEHEHIKSDTDDGSNTLGDSFAEPETPNGPLKPYPLYARDLTCPDEYHNKVKQLIPEYLLPLGTNDLFGCMPHDLRAENLMCYLGSHHTGTALHRDICGTFGHNLMSYAEPGAFSEWYIIENGYRDKLASMLRPRKSERICTDEDMESNIKSSFVESDRAWVYMSHLKHIPTHIVIQKPGDLVLIPSLCYHQVRNVGISVKIAWNRATANTLLLALEDHLPIYRSIVRPEVYRCKAMVFYTLTQWKSMLNPYCTKDSPGRPDEILQLPMLQRGLTHFLEDCRILLNLFASKVIIPETIEPIALEGVEDNNIVAEKEGYPPFTTVCDFCRCDIFYRYYHCDKCENYDLCLHCYAQGRSCQHVDDMVMLQGGHSIEDYYTLYTSFINCVNTALDNEYLFSEIPSNHYQATEQHSLATICRRLEAYRRKTGPFANYLLCGHCDVRTTLNELYMDYDIDIPMIFGRRMCRKMTVSDKNNIIYSCENCAAKCPDCHFIGKIRKRQKVDKERIIYFYPPYQDDRNWGGPRDQGIYKSYFWPDRIVKISHDGPEEIHYGHGLRRPLLEDIHGKIMAALIRCMRQNTWSRVTHRHEIEKLGTLLAATANIWSQKIHKKLPRNTSFKDLKTVEFTLGTEPDMLSEIDEVVDTKKVKITIRYFGDPKSRKKTRHEKNQ